MTQVVERERNEKMATWELMSTAIGSFLGHNTEHIKKILRPLRDALAGEVFQTDYDPDMLLSQLRTRLMEVRKTKSDLERLTNMSVG